MVNKEDKKEEVYASSPIAQHMARFTDDAGHIIIPASLELDSFLSRLYFYCPEKD